MILPLPETETVGNLARLDGGSCSVGVGEAVTVPMAARAEAIAMAFMMKQYQAIKPNEYGSSDGGFICIEWSLKSPREWRGRVVRLE